MTLSVPLLSGCEYEKIKKTLLKKSDMFISLPHSDVIERKHLTLCPVVLVRVTIIAGLKHHGQSNLGRKALLGSYFLLRVLH